jgi:hypothetical protein
LISYFNFQLLIQATDLTMSSSSYSRATNAPKARRTPYARPKQSLYKNTPISERALSMNNLFRNKSRKNRPIVQHRPIVYAGPQQGPEHAHNRAIAMAQEAHAFYIRRTTE